METATMTPPGGIVNEKRRHVPRPVRAVRFSVRVPRPVLPGRVFSSPQRGGSPYPPRGNRRFCVCAARPIAHSVPPMPECTETLPSSAVT